MRRVDVGERAWLMREALERARRDLAFLGSLAHITQDEPYEALAFDVGPTVRWIDCALEGLEPLDLDSRAEPPVNRSADE